MLGCMKKVLRVLTCAVVFFTLDLISVSSHRSGVIKESVKEMKPSVTSKGSGRVYRLGQS
jgi:hypothetical protein